MLTPTDRHKQRAREWLDLKGRDCPENACAECEDDVARLALMFAAIEAETIERCERECRLEANTWPNPYTEGAAACTGCAVRVASLKEKP